ncbi:MULTISPECIES: hypothetical protein [Streptomyces]|uniref:Uncharacterized protein n=1 Tax=Streptomyces viridochromogenes TaxID=1938 RepID=A0A0L8J9U0_STRVR|nr:MULTISPECIES: hypothetical protein [Streptomyces]KOG10284.1 hypothetical protein ADK34_35750 [Streptomyces viridochromogenes]
MPQNGHGRPAESWFQAEALVEELLCAGGLYNGGSLESRATREVLTLTAMFCEEGMWVCGEVRNPVKIDRSLTRLRYAIRSDALWHAWCSGRLLTVQGANGVDAAYARRSWRWLTRDRTVPVDDVPVRWAHEDGLAEGGARDATMRGYPSLDRLTVWELGLVRARMALDNLLLAQVGVLDVIGSVVLVGKGAPTVPEGEPGFVLEAVWAPDELLTGTARRVTSLRVALADGSTARVSPQQLISLGELPAAG